MKPIAILLVLVLFQGCAHSSEYQYIPNPNELVRPFAMPLEPLIEGVRLYDDYFESPVRIESYRSSDGSKWELRSYQILEYVSTEDFERIEIDFFLSPDSYDRSVIIEKRYRDEKIVSLQQWKTDGAAEPELYINRRISYNDSVVTVDLFDNGRMSSVYQLTYSNGLLSRYTKEKYRAGSGAWNLSFDRNYSYGEDRDVIIENLVSEQTESLIYGEDSIIIEEEYSSSLLTLNQEGQTIREEKTWMPGGQWSYNIVDYKYNEKGLIDSKTESYFLLSDSGETVHSEYYRKDFYYQ